MAKKTAVKSTTPPAKTTSTGNASTDEQIGFHKGSLMTLSKEREEMVRILGIVEQLMQMHTVALKELGVNLEQTAANAPANGAPKRKPPIEDIL